MANKNVNDFQYPLFNDVLEGMEKKNDSGSSLPAVTSADNGKVLSVVNGAWAADDNRFVVTLTPTEADYSGTMDKTTAEIDDAWNSGKSIWFRVTRTDGLFPLALRYESDVGTQYSAYAINLDANVLVLTSTSPNSNQYGTTIYQLTLMGS